MDLYIIRHAAAGQYGDPRWPDDTQRPLSQKGIERFTNMVELLAGRGFAPEIIASSPMVRCLETARLVAGAVRGKPDVVELEGLLPDGELDALLRWTTEHSGSHQQIAWIGHAPDVSRLTGELIGARQSLLCFAKGAVAAIRFPDQPEIAGGELRWLVTPKVLGC